MKLFKLVLVFIMAFLDMVTTFIAMNIFGTCVAENNMFLRSICIVYGYNATWLWLPVEFVAILLVFYGIEKLRLFFNSRFKVRVPPIPETLFLLVVSIPVLNNVLVLLYRVSLSDLLAVP